MMSERAMPLPMSRLSMRIKHCRELPDDVRAEMLQLLDDAYIETTDDMKIVIHLQRDASAAKSLAMTVLRDGGATAMKRGVTAACQLAEVHIHKMRELQGTYESILRSNKLMPEIQSEMF